MRLTLYTRSKSPGATFYCQIMVNGVRRQFCTHTSDREEAMFRVLAEKRRMRLGLPKESVVIEPDATIEQILDYYWRSPVRVTTDTKQHAVRALKIIMRANGLKATDTLAKITRGTVINFQQKWLGPVPTESQIITCNSYLRHARSIFSAERMDEYRAQGLRIPDITGWMKANYLKEPRRQYVPPPRDVVNRLYTATPADRRLYAAHLLCSYAGLRAGEVAESRPTWLVDHDDLTILRVPAEIAKSNADRLIPLDPPVVADLRECAAWSGNGYFIPGKTENARYTVVVKDYNAWLTQMGITTRKKSHAIRKLFGSRVATEHGIYAAQKLLGHSSPQLTSKVYAGLTELPTPIRTAVG